MEIASENVSLSRLRVLTAEKKTLFRFSQEVINQSFVKIALENKDRRKSLGIKSKKGTKSIKGITLELTSVSYLHKIRSTFSSFYSSLALTV